VTANVSPRGPAHTLAVGTTVDATVQDVVSSRSNSTGQRVRGIVSRNVLDAAGGIVIPGGSTVTLTIAKLRPAKNAGADDGLVALALTSVTVGDSSFVSNGDVSSVPHSLAAGIVPGARDVVVGPGTPISIRLTTAFSPSRGSGSAAK
jgi:type IV secretory pathway VirB10-like protein